MSFAARLLLFHSEYRAPADGFINIAPSRTASAAPAVRCRRMTRRLLNILTLLSLLLCAAAVALWVRSYRCQDQESLLFPSGRVILAWTGEGRVCWADF